MSHVTKDFLLRVFREIPHPERVAFLNEVLESLNEQERKAFLDQAPGRNVLPSTSPWDNSDAAAAFGLSPDAPQPEVAKIDLKPAPPPSSASSQPVASLKKPPSNRLSPDAVKDLPPEEIMKRVEAAAQQKNPEETEENPEVQFNDQVDKQFNKIMFEHGEMGTSPTDLRRQFISCIGLGVLIFAGLVAISAAGTKLFEWLKSLVGL